MTPEQFNADFTPYANKVGAATGLNPGLFLAQWAVETAYASAFAGSYNLGNITRGGAANGFVDYGSYDQFCDAEILTLHGSLYTGVLGAASRSLYDQCIALGESPWDAGHYIGNPPDNFPGGSLIANLPTLGFNAAQIGVPMTAEQDALLRQIFNLLMVGFYARNGDNSPQAASEGYAYTTLLPAIKAVSATPVDLTALKAEVDNLAAAVGRIEAALKTA